MLDAPAELSPGDLDPAQLEGIVIDNQFATVSPAWKGPRGGKPRLGPAYFYDLDARDGRATPRFDVDARQPARYRVKLLFPVDASRATYVPVEISGDGKTFRATVNERKPADWIGGFDPPAKFTVSITNSGANGMVAIDGLQMVTEARD